MSTIAKLLSSKVVGVANWQQKFSTQISSKASPTKTTSLKVLLQLRSTPVYAKLKQ
jgi:hypothetical protein